MKGTIGIAVLLLAASLCAFGQDKEQVMAWLALLHDIDEQSVKSGNEIIYLEEFNFGIPGGANLLVEWEGKFFIYTNLYAVDFEAGEIKFNGSIEARGRGNSDPYIKYIDFFDNGSFPGVTRRGGKYQIGDFNGDGFDEIAEFYEGPNGPRFSICGYDPQEGNIQLYIDIPHGPVEIVGDRWMPPVEFIMYSGMQGFQIQYFEGEVARGEGWAPEPNPRNGWFFFTWDKRERIFVSKGEVEPQYIGVDINRTQMRDAPVTAAPVENPVLVISEESNLPMAAVEWPSEETVHSNSHFEFIVVLVIGVIALSVAIIPFAVWKRSVKK